MNADLKKLENGNIELVMSIPWKTVEETYNLVVDDTVKEAELPGFRKGKAPRATVELQLDKNKAYETVLDRLIPDVYAQAVSEHKLKPVISPQITLTKAKEAEDWVITAITCEKPIITIGDYRKAITELKNEKRNKIWVPGQEPQTISPGKQGEEQEKEQKPSLDELLHAVYHTISVTLPPILTEQEVTRMLSNFLDQTKKLGITIDQYLQSTGKTIETLRYEYEEEAKRTITMELALGDIADKEGITVEDAEVEHIINTAKTPEEKEGLSKEKYYVASILRRQKTIQLLATV